MEENRAKGMTGIWSLTPEQVVEANKAPLLPERGSWEASNREIEFKESDGRQLYDGDVLALEESGDRKYILRVNGDEQELDKDELYEELLNMMAYVPSMDDIVDSMEEFEAAKEAGEVPSQ